MIKAHIGRKSSGNTIIQGSELHNPVFLSNTADLIRTFGDIGQYEAVEKLTIDTLSAVSRVHPLYPDFSAKPDSDMQRLISTPETEDAFQKYPKRIKGTYRLDYSKYPYMDKSETPWEYAYRTQTKVELQTTAYQEYLGDVVDPFPVTRYADGMITVIGAPEFPPAVEAIIASGEISLTTKLRRKPCMEYGKMIFGSTSEDCGFEFELVVYKDQERTDCTITKMPGCDLFTQLQRERLIVEMSKTKHLSVSVEQVPLMDVSFKENELSADMFRLAPYMVRYLESLMLIEERTNCRFDLTDDDILEDDYRTALILATSLDGKWTKEKSEFDNDVRCDYDHISDDLVGNSTDKSEIVIVGKELDISLQGQRFFADKYIIVYKDAKINNLASVQKNQKNRKKNILFTFKPIQGKEFFTSFIALKGFACFQMDKIDTHQTLQGRHSEIIPFSLFPAAQILTHFSF